MQFKTLLVLCFLNFFSLSVLAQDTRNVLFIGNSYTAFNNLPNLVGLMAESVDDTLNFQAHTPGGAQFVNHYNSATVHNLIKNGNWDFVVLQGQSQETSFQDSYINNNVMPYVRNLCDSIDLNSTCAMPMLYMTWGRENGDQSNCASWPPVCTYEGMDSIIQANYLKMARAKGTEVSPVGAVWRAIRDQYPSIQLYNADESHPSVIGTYAAAACFYTSIYKKNPVGISYKLSDTSISNQILTIVKEEVYDSLPKWGLDQSLYIPGFTYSIENRTVRISANTRTAEIYQWRFGDGASATQRDVIYTLNDTAIFLKVELTIKMSYCDKYYEFSDTIFLFPSQSIESIEKLSFSIYPNPSSKQITIKCEKAIELVQIYNMNSALVVETAKTEHLDISELNSGYYFIKVETADGIIAVQRLLIE